MKISWSVAKRGAGRAVIVVATVAVGSAVLLTAPEVEAQTTQPPPLPQRTQPAQTTQPSQAPPVGPPIRELGAALAATEEPLMTSSQVRALPGGRVLVNDGSARRLLMFDSTMKLVKVVADSAVGSPISYGLRPGRLLPYHGDSSLLVDPASYSMLVIDGDGKISRVRAVPRTDHASYYGGTSTLYGVPGLDAQGRLVYKGNDPIRFISMAAGGGVMVPEQPDSSPIFRVDFETRKLDTIGQIKIQKRITEAVQMASGGISSRTMTNPMPVQDDWAVVSDGSVAFLRHRDYHLEWLNPDGTRTNSPPMPFDWQRLTDDHKRAFVDSVRNVLDTSRRMSIARIDSINGVCFGPEAAAASAGDARAPGRAGGAIVGNTVVVSGRGAPPPPPATRGATAGGATGAATPPASAGVPAVRPPTCPQQPMFTSAFTPASVIPYDALPDYKPPFAASALRADADNNVWIRVNQMQPVAGTNLYDIANRQGELVDRIRTPVARTIVGFAPGGIVYTSIRQGTTLKLERVRWR